jgi:hypothetical protein
VPLEGHWKRQNAPLRPRQRLVGRIGLGLLAVAAVAVVLVIALAGGDSTKAGCVDVKVASTTGGAAIHACGERAKRLCASPDTPQTVRAQCRRAGY